MALKVEQGKELARQHATKVAADALVHGEQVLVIAREQNAQLVAELAHTRQQAL